MIEIPLKNGAKNARQTFTVQLGGNRLEIRVYFLSYIDHVGWGIDIYRDKTPLVLGSMLEPNSDVAANFNVNIGRFVFIGDQPTLDNLGVDNKLIWAVA